MRISDWSSDVCSSDLGDVPDLDHMPDRLRLGDERAAARAAYDDSRRLQFAKRPICGHARDVKFLDQLCFRRDAITRLQTPVANRIRYALKIGRESCRDRVGQ